MTLNPKAGLYLYFLSFLLIPFMVLNLATVYAQDPTDEIDDFLADFNSGESLTTKTGLSTRAVNALVQESIKTVEDLLELARNIGAIDFADYLSRVPNVGRDTKKEILSFVKKRIDENPLTDFILEPYATTGLSNRAVNALLQEKINTVEELLQMARNIGAIDFAYYLSRVRNVGRDTQKEILSFVKKRLDEKPLTDFILEPYATTGLSNRAVNALLQEKINTVEDLLQIARNTSALDFADYLSRIPRIGPDTKKEILNFVKKRLKENPLVLLKGHDSFETVEKPGCYKFLKESQ